MIKVTVTARSGEDVYALLTKKEIELRKRNQGTLHRAGPKRKEREKWSIPPIMVGSNSNAVLEA